MSLLLPALMLSRMAQRSAPVDPAREFEIPAAVNRVGAAVMTLERALIKSGLSFPAGGSLLAVARR